MKLKIVCALAACCTLAPAASITVFNYSATVTSYTVPVTGLYRIVTFGAQGGMDPYYLNRPTFSALVGLCPWILTILAAQALKLAVIFFFMRAMF